MFHPIITSAQIYEERPREHLPVWHASQHNKNLPTRWDYFLLNLGNLLINTGRRVRSNSAVACCADANRMEVKPAGGNA